MKGINAKLKLCLKLAFACVFVLFIVCVLAINLLFPLKYTDSINRYSKKFGVDRSLVYSVIWTESKFDSSAKSSAGAVGLMQLMPKTAEWCCDMLNEVYDYESLKNPDFNIKIGTYYLAYLIDKYGEESAITAYNAGEGNLLEWNGKIEFDETKTYIKRVAFVQKIYALKLRR